MTVSLLLTAWVVASVPLAVLLGGMIGGADQISAARQQPPRRLPTRYRPAGHRIA